MFRVLEVGPDGPVRASAGSAHVAPPPDGSLRWIDLQGQDEAQLEMLRSQFGFHPLAIEDCAKFDQRPKLEEYGDHLFIVTHSLACPDSDPAGVEVQELHAFLGHRYLVTVHTQPMPALEEVWDRVVNDAPLARRGADFLYYLVADQLVDAHFPLLDHISDALEDLETSVLEDANTQDLAQIFRLKRALVTMRKALSPQRDVFGLLAKRGAAQVSEKTAFYFRDVYDHLMRLTESIETNRDLLGNALDAYLSMVSNRTNEVMKGLTIMSAIFLPLAFIVGFFGQNFDNLPFLEGWTHDDRLMWFMIVACVSLPAAMLAWFRRNGWV
jgi:magnesium transporter